MSDGFHLTLSAAHIDALLYTVGAFNARSNRLAAAHRSALLKHLETVTIVGPTERVVFPHSTLDVLLLCLKHAIYCLDPTSAAKLSRQVRRIREHLAASAVDRLGALAG